MSATLLERITGRRAQTDARRLDSYRDLVVAVADNADIDEARADAILLDAAKSPDQLVADVEELERRRLDAEAAAPLADLQKQRTELSNSLVGLREAIRQAEIEYREKTAETNRKLAALDGQIHDARAAAVRLRQGRPDTREAGLRAERAELSRQRDQMLEKLGNDALGLRGRLRNLRAALKGGMQMPVGEIRGSLEPSIVPGLAYDENTLRDGIAVCESEVRGAEAELAKVESRLAEVNKTLTAIEAAQLVP